jgi:hypothetical protein
MISRLEYWLIVLGIGILLGPVQLLGDRLLERWERALMNPPGKGQRGGPRKPRRKRVPRPKLRLRKRKHKDQQHPGKPAADHGAKPPVKPPGPRGQPRHRGRAPHPRPKVQTA